MAEHYEHTHFSSAANIEEIYFTGFMEHTIVIRPFLKGSERLAQFLSNVILIWVGYTFFGEISISSVIARSNCEYFLAITNILKTGNGADLTYFLEYYITTPSATVNDLHSKLKQQRQNTLKEVGNDASFQLNQ